MLRSPLLELIQLKVDVQPWVLTNTVDYIRRSKTTAVAESCYAGSRATATRIGRRHPTSLNKMADLCLSAGIGSELYQIDAVTVVNVFHELDGHAETVLDQ